MYVKRSDINPIKMSSNPLKCIEEADFQVISNGNVMKWVGIGWIKEREAVEEDYEDIPQLLQPHCSNCKHYDILPQCTMYCNVLHRRITSRKKPCRSYEENI